MRLYSAKDTYNFKEPTNSSHPIPTFLGYYILQTKCEHTHAHTHTHTHTHLFVILQTKHKLKKKVCSIVSCAHCNTLQCGATDCNSVQLSATHCNTLQHSKEVAQCQVQKRILCYYQSRLEKGNTAEINSQSSYKPRKSKLCTRDKSGGEKWGHKCRRQKRHVRVQGLGFRVQCLGFRVQGLAPKL